jgi:hypothetical protein
MLKLHLKYMFKKAWLAKQKMTATNLKKVHELLDQKLAHRF